MISSIQLLILFQLIFSCTCKFLLGFVFCIYCLEFCKRYKFLSPWFYLVTYMFFVQIVHFIFFFDFSSNNPIFGFWSSFRLIPVSSWCTSFQTFLFTFSLSVWDVLGSSCIFPVQCKSSHPHSHPESWYKLIWLLSLLGSTPSYRYS